MKGTTATELSAIDRNFGLALARALAFFFAGAIAGMGAAIGVVFMPAVRGASLLVTAVFFLTSGFVFVVLGLVFFFVFGFTFETTFLVDLADATVSFAADAVIFLVVNCFVAVFFFVTDDNFLVPTDLEGVALRWVDVFLAIGFFVLAFTQNHRLQSSAF